ncbi:MAG: hypothetical protein IJF27_08540 [Oscillospiraceae bacterium]|nr:hypothetical protein [Oscillospiraceae bacterium]
MKKQDAKRKKPTKKAMDTLETSAAKTDPMGSYTGKPQNEKEQPVQDADDL